MTNKRGRSSLKWQHLHDTMSHNIAHCATCLPPAGVLIQSDGCHDSALPVWRLPVKPTDELSMFVDNVLFPTKRLYLAPKGEFFFSLSLFLFLWEKIHGLQLLVLVHFSRSSRNSSRQFYRSLCAISPGPNLPVATSSDSGDNIWISRELVSLSELCQLHTYIL